MAHLQDNIIAKLAGSIYYNKTQTGPENYGEVRIGQTGRRKKEDWTIGNLENSMNRAR
jgi:hypothetical protein